MKIYAVIRDFLVQILPFTAKLFGLKKKEISWVVHPRNMEDLQKKIPILKALPQSVGHFLILLLPPFIVSEFKNGNNSEGGYIIVVPSLPKDFAKHKFLTAFKVKQALKLARHIGAKKVSVGGFLTTVVERANLAKKVGIEVFDGTELLAEIAAGKIAEMCQEYTTINSKPCAVGIIGATTKTGSKIAKSILDQGAELHFFAKTKANIDKLKSDCLAIRPEANISTYTSLDSLGKCDLVILTAYITEDSEAIARSLKSGSTFFSVIEPVSPFVEIIANKRKDIKLIKGITIKSPAISYRDFDFVIPSGHVYACLTEAIISDGFTSNTEGKGMQSIMDKNNFKIA